MSNQNTFDAVVIGAGFAGMYMLHRLRNAGFSTRVYEKGGGVGGAWYWSRYPGARCDSESIYYNYTFSEEIYQEWSWSSRYPEQAEILRYLNFVADKLDLRRDIQFDSEIAGAAYDEANNHWRIDLKDGTSVTAKYLITGMGCISVNATNIPQIKGLDSFEGAWYHTGAWPHDKVDFTGKRVGVIGTGSSGVQSIPVIAQEAEHLTVFQRTPQYSVPAGNHPYDPAFIQQAKENFSDLRRQMHESMGGIPVETNNRSALDDTTEERERIYESGWGKGGFYMLNAYNDLMINEEANETVSEFIRTKIRDTVQDSEVAEKLMPTYYFGTKRAIIDTHYYETFNRDNVTLVDVRRTPIQEVTAKGIRTTDGGEHELDILVFATGYDGMTGPLLKLDLRGKGNVSLREKWADGADVKTYLGIAMADFPNMFMITGPQSPSVLGNVPVAIEQHVEWISNCIQHLHDHGVETIEAQADAQAQWSSHCRELADHTLYSKADSWYTGANIEGKPRGFNIYLGGYGPYNQKITDIAAKGYEGFSLKTSAAV
ncbi:cation diffusion facilitator CzcD-associated flavoprotein CzcO [Paenibacillus cellulosilyticus]|uniref:Cation diffusion facilitator CzcD-associated flavoprotein CzcO n=1 Tax=Paenibacillus cellulosilyticus TaxID=375489 RepID=A0A2V2YQE6_9BACL|nr:NAD(P)/FAD-dependent oxidoreductase [Paenibacillus cellulosilyticus]PWV99342.1 cation diffusion facilitator CzcD-associated flavoprotein CzcO [Paenibacillus cellulosilyticus]QKS45106.1 NAD(P)/FAD-dependent oxidoreductase [Paenibacillus cellulosilyticus]